MTIQQPVEILTVRIERQLQSLPVFSLEQTIQSRLGRETNPLYPPLAGIHNPDELQRIGDEFRYSSSYLKLFKDHPEKITNELETTKKQLIETLSTLPAAEIVTQFATNCDENDTPPTLAHRAVRLKTLETLKTIPIQDYPIRFKELAQKLETAHRLVRFYHHKELFIIGAEKAGITSGIYAKILEYVTRKTRVVQELQAGQLRRFPQGFENDRHDERNLDQDLNQFGFDYDSLRDFAIAYRIPKISGDPNNRALCDFAFASRCVRVSNEISAQQITQVSTSADDSRIMLNSSSLSYDPEKMLLAAQTHMADRYIFYPHTDGSGQIKSVTLIEVNPHQRYEIERKARQILANKGSLATLYPEKKVVSSSGAYQVRQNKDGTIVYSGGTGELIYENGLLDFPLTPYRKIDIVLTDNEGTASFNPLLRHFGISRRGIERILSPDKTDRLSGKEVALIVARHELNHAYWADLSKVDREKIIRLFDLSDQSFRRFVGTFMRDNEYASRAMADVTRDPTIETLEVEYRGRKVKLVKNV